MSNNSKIEALKSILLGSKNIVKETNIEDKIDKINKEQKDNLDGLKNKLSNIKEDNQYNDLKNKLIYVNTNIESNNEVELSLLSDNTILKEPGIDDTVNDTVNDEVESFDNNDISINIDRKETETEAEAEETVDILSINLDEYLDNKTEDTIYFGYIDKKTGKQYRRIFKKKETELVININITDIYLLKDIFNTPFDVYYDNTLIMDFINYNGEIFIDNNEIRIYSSSSEYIYKIDDTKLKIKNITI